MPTDDKPAPDKPLTYPAAVLLQGGPARDRLDLAYHIADHWPRCQAHSFLSPVREGMVGTFFQGDPSVDLNSLLDQPINEQTQLTFGKFQSLYEAFLRSNLGQDYLGFMASKRLEENLDWFATFVFDDADSVRNIRHIVDMFEPMTCIVVNMPGSVPLHSERAHVITLEGFVTLEEAFATIEAFRQKVFAND